MSELLDNRQTNGQTDAEAFSLDRFMPYRLAVLGDGVSRALARAYADAEDLTIPEWRVLAVVSAFDPAAARDVVAATPMDKMAVSRAAISLERKGLITRAPSPEDRRANVLKLTEKGRGAFGRVAERTLDLERDILAALSEDEAAVFDRILAKLQARVDRKLSTPI